jgi:hypothetical protein
MAITMAFRLDCSPEGLDEMLRDGKTQTTRSRSLEVTFCVPSGGA